MLEIHITNGEIEIRKDNHRGESRLIWGTCGSGPLSDDEWGIINRWLDKS